MCCWIRREIKDCAGFLNKCNDVIFLGNKICPTVNLVYFGGDVQDYEQNMLKNNVSSQYIKWSLENTAQILYERFTNQFTCSNPHIWIIRPSHWIADSIACYPNFLPFTKHGIPFFESDEIYRFKAIRQLNSLLSNAVKQLSDDECYDGNCQLSNIPVRLIGFSKGCCVLTELIYEFSLLCSTVTTVTEETDELCKSLQHIYWLDSGHSGIHHQWPVSNDYLSLLKSSTCPTLHIHATPYQILNRSRPQKSVDFQRFVNILSECNLPFTKKLHFMPDTSTKNGGSLVEDSEKYEEDCSLQRHFEILNHFDF